MNACGKAERRCRHRIVRARQSSTQCRQRAEDLLLGVPPRRGSAQWLTHHGFRHALVSRVLSTAVVVVAALAVVTTAGTTFYVATNGSDAASCNAAQRQATPKRTLNDAVTCLSAGSTLYVRGGTYAEALFDVIPSGTSWSQPVTVAAYPGETVTLQPAAGEQVLHFENNHQYIVIDGLILDGAHVVREVVKITYANDPATSAHHIRIQNSELKNAPAQGILVGGATGFNEFINLTVHDNGRTDFEHGMYIANNNNVIDRCTVYRNAGWGLHLFGGSPSHNTVRNNRVYNNARAGARGPGIGIYGPNNLAYNNVLWGNNGGFELDGTANVELYNNTIYNNNAGTDGPGIAIGVASNTIIRNNIIYQNSFSVGGSGTVADHNLVGGRSRVCERRGARPPPLAHQSGDRRRSDDRDDHDRRGPRRAAAGCGL